MLPKALITGISGLLGNNLALFFREKCDVLGLFNNNPVEIPGIEVKQCDLSDKESVSHIIDHFAPNIILHCASLTDIDQCENFPEKADQVNVTATQNLVDSLADLPSSKLVYISSESVYGGQKGSFQECDQPAPYNYYGKSKLAGEQVVLKKDDSLVLRTNIFGWNIQDKTSLGEWVLNELKGGSHIKGFIDARVSTIYTCEFAKIIYLSLKKELSGIYNCASKDSCSKYEFALKLAHWFGYDKDLIQPISIDQYNFKTRRVKDLSLCVKKIEKDLDFHLPSINYSVECFYRDYHSGLPNQIKENNKVKYSQGRGIPYGRQFIDNDDIEAVINVLKSELITTGPKAREFEQKICEVSGAKYAVAVANGTAALHLASLCLLQENDQVLTTPNSFIATANSILYAEAKPVFVDIQADGNIDLDQCEKEIQKNPNIKAIYAVHFSGNPVDQDKLRDLTSKYNVKILEDCAHSLGASYEMTNGVTVKAGSCQYSDLSVFSFHPVKHITTGEGGAITTNSEEDYQKLLTLRNHGMIRDPEKFTQKDLAFDLEKKVNPWYYEMHELGFNYRITDFQCALGMSQLGKLDRFVQRRREIAKIYDQAFKNHCRLRPLTDGNQNSSCHLYVTLIDFEKAGVTRADFCRKLSDHKIGVMVHYIPINKQPYYQSLGYGDEQTPQMDLYYQTAISLPMFPSITDEEQTYIIDEIKKII
jgi:UDP-4-amino-4,6-dideoxy-L-N-acetyl-beta-L-altrosamine transaminase